MLQMSVGTSLWLCSASGTAIAKPERILHRVDTPWVWRDRYRQGIPPAPWVTTTCGQSITVAPVTARVRRCTHCVRMAAKKPPSGETLVVTDHDFWILLEWAARDLSNRSWFKSDMDRVLGDVLPTARRWSPPSEDGSPRPLAIQRSLGI